MQAQLFERFLQQLPFVFTREQKEAVQLLHKDAEPFSTNASSVAGRCGQRQNRCSVLSACLPAINEGFQVAWLASYRGTCPADIFCSFAVVYGSGNLPETAYRQCCTRIKKKQIVKDCANGSIAFVVGTHALLQSGVTFKKLGMIVIDEQHKFGAQQRAALQEKDPLADVLLLSATPIPQSACSKRSNGDLGHCFPYAVCRGIVKK